MYLLGYYHMNQLALLNELHVTLSVNVHVTLTALLCMINFGLVTFEGIVSLGNGNRNNLTVF